jgi:hypothetical protein
MAIDQQEAVGKAMSASTADADRTKQAIKEQATLQPPPASQKASAREPVYVICSMPTLKELEKEVNKGIGFGYRPYGTLSIHPAEERDPQRPLRFTQVLVDKELC